ncbi:MAG: hypothetical protein IIA49_10640 [Bacteroidetes bacterium]|nr:hypothetical protein [Bacteroidota bacterium]
MKKISDTIKIWISGRLEYAITGKVEANQFEPLGVYLDNVQSTASRYFIDNGEFEDVVIFGTVRGRTLDDPINLKVGCFVERDGKNEHAELEDPRDKFTIFAFEEQDFACTFTEDQLKDKKIHYAIGKYSYINSGMGLALDDKEGFVKIFAHRKTRKILGCHILGSQASTLIHEVIVAMKAGLSVDAIRNTVHIHPALSEVVQRAVNSIEW